MLVEFDLNIALSLCDVCPSSDIDEVANVLLACFVSRNKTLVLLEAVIEKEVNNTSKFKKPMECLAGGIFTWVENTR